MISTFLLVSVRAFLLKDQICLDRPADKMTSVKLDKYN